MNGRFISHWGLITWPDSEWLENILLNTDGSFEKLDDELPSKVQSEFRPFYFRTLIGSATICDCHCMIEPPPANFEIDHTPKPWWSNGLEQRK